jgi:hypothetical protein
VKGGLAELTLHYLLDLVVFQVHVGQGRVLWTELVEQRSFWLAGPETQKVLYWLAERVKV